MVLNLGRRLKEQLSSDVAMKILRASLLGDFLYNGDFDNLAPLSGGGSFPGIWAVCGEVAGSSAVQAEPLATTLVFL